MLKLGMLWYNNTKKTLLDGIPDAIRYYSDKYGKHPDICEIHPNNSDFPDVLVYSDTNSIKLVKNKVIMPNYCFLGMNSE